ncbi:MAG TPA: hypothetical protein PKZ58_07510 [Bacillota bacterium]|nr:hypothetical protein [Bacillota bacterium]
MCQAVLIKQFPEVYGRGIFAVFEYIILIAQFYGNETVRRNTCYFIYFCGNLMFLLLGYIVCRLLLDKKKIDDEGCVERSAPRTILLAV